MLESVAGLLRSSDYLVETAKSLADARSLFANAGFDLVIADWQLAAREHGGNSQNVHGFEAPGLGPRILWMSAAVPDKDAKSLLAEPSAGILQKPFQATELLAAVDERLLRPVPTLVQN